MICKTFPETFGQNCHHISSSRAVFFTAVSCSTAFVLYRSRDVVVTVVLSIDKQRFELDCELQSIQTTAF